MRSRKMQLNVRLTEEEYVRLKHYAENTGHSVSMYVRMLIGGYAPKALPPVDYHLLMKEIKSFHQQLSDHLGFVGQNAAVDGILMSDMLSRYEQLLLQIQAAVLLPDQISR